MKRQGVLALALVSAVLQGPSLPARAESPNLVLRGLVREVGPPVQVVDLASGKIVKIDLPRDCKALSQVPVRPADIPKGAEVQVRLDRKGAARFVTQRAPGAQGAEDGAVLRGKWDAADEESVTLLVGGKARTLTRSPYCMFFREQPEKEAKARPGERVLIVYRSARSGNPKAVLLRHMGTAEAEAPLEVPPPSPPPSPNARP